MHTKILLAFAAMLPLSACVMGPGVSEFDGYSCRQLQAELQLTQEKIDERRQRQIVGAALTVLGMPPGDGSDRPYDPETGRLLDRRDALRHLLIKNDCPQQGTLL